MSFQELLNQKKSLVNEVNLFYGLFFEKTMDEVNMESMQSKFSSI